ncbi:MAG: YXWGXW repeat-containing protein [Chitinophagaceae bacterium]|nr:YXWGXW repeat-containing protein [Chitinophagaceae bacterium]
MKKSLTRFLFLMAVLFTASFSASSQIYVKIRPPRPPVVVRPPQPSRVHVWVDEDWQRYGNSYRYSGGHWSNPPHRGYNWIPGHWQRSRYGERWVPGHWGQQRRRH